MSQLFRKVITNFTIKKIINQINFIMSENAKIVTLGEKRVRVEFNPSNVGNVNFIKEKTAELINACEDLKPKDGSVLLGEKARLISLAQTAYEEAAMWAVKAATC
jgi:hypothetical protein